MSMAEAERPWPGDALTGEREAREARTGMLVFLIREPPREKREERLEISD
jgi:hypothetical protein